MYWYLKTIKSSGLLICKFVLLTLTVDLQSKLKKKKKLAILVNQINSIFSDDEDDAGDMTGKGSKSCNNLASLGVPVDDK